MPRQYIRGTLKERFWPKVIRGDSCWEWQGAKDPSGYGRVKVGDGTKLAHRVAWELTSGPVPDDLFVLHHCDNPSCCRPDHLFLGTNQDNMTDMVAKGRYKARHNLPNGERQHLAKLTEEQVRLMRSLHPGRTATSLAHEFGVSVATACKVIRHETWRHVT
jgi:hypothetical protein